MKVVWNLLPSEEYVECWLQCPRMHSTALLFSHRSEKGATTGSGQHQLSAPEQLQLPNQESPDLHNSSRLQFWGAEL